MIASLEDQLRRDEGEVLSAYQDHLGFWTIGIGRLIDKRKGGGISRMESSFLLMNDIADKERQVRQRFPWAVSLDPVRFAVLVNMAFQMGIEGLAGFKNTLSMIQGRRFDDAAKGMLQSKWAQQTPQRAMRLSEQMRTGTWH